MLIALRCWTSASVVAGTAGSDWGRNGIGFMQPMSGIAVQQLLVAEGVHQVQAVVFAGAAKGAPLMAAS